MELLVGFRTLQAIADLQALVTDTLNADGDCLPFERPQTRALARLVAEEHCCFASDASFALLPGLEAIATDPSATDSLVALANGLLMANALQGGDRLDTVAELWTANLDRLRRLPPTLRGPLASAAQCTVSWNLLSAGAQPTRDDRMTVDPDRTSRALVAIAQSATEEELLHIARADYGCGCDRHLRTLRQVIWHQDCIFADDQGWYPAEVVELVSHVPNQTGFAVATAILLNHCVHKGDLQGSTDFRWENNARAYMALPRPLRTPILAGFRAIYESDPGWAPYYSALFDVTEHRAILLPPADTELTRL
jgi:hypothetical protein